MGSGEFLLSWVANRLADESRKITKKECGYRPSAAGWSELSLSEKRAENHQKGLSPPAQRCERIDILAFQKKGRKSPKRNVAAGPALR